MIAYLATGWYFLSFAAGLFALGLGSGLWLQYRRPGLGSYLVFLTGLQIILGMLIANLLAPGAPGSAASEWAGKIGVLLVMGALPRFLDAAMDPSPPRRRRIRDGLWIVQMLLAILSGRTGPLDIPGVVVMIPFILVFVESLVRFLREAGHVGDRSLRRALWFLFYASLAYFPLFLLESLRARWPHITGGVNIEVLTLPTYFQVINGAGIFLSARVYNQPAWSEGYVPTEAFRQSFDITDREAEILTAMLRGDSNDEIAYGLGISSKTVGNRLSEIYRKCGVNSRIQMANLMRGDPRD